MPEPRLNLGLLPTNPGPPRLCLNDLALLPETGRLATQFAQVVELGSLDLVPLHQVDLAHVRRVQREHSLHTHSPRDLANREGRARATRVARDDHALERLQALLVTFLDLDLYLHRIANPEFRRLLPDLPSLELRNLIRHCLSPSTQFVVRPRGQPRHHAQHAYLAPNVARPPAPAVLPDPAAGRRTDRASARECGGS